MKITENIKDYIKTNGITQSYIADKLGMKQDTFCIILNGKRKLAIDEYCKICNVLNVPFEYFLQSPSSPSSVS